MFQRLSKGIARVLFFAATFTVLAGTARADQSAAAAWLAGLPDSKGIYAGSQRSASDYQAVSESLRALKLLGRVPPDLATSYQFLEADSHLSTEHLSRRIVAKQLENASSPDLLAELGARQNADGGYGEFSGYQSNTLDTAYALEAFALAGQLSSSGISLAISYLTSRQQAEGGWTDHPTATPVFTSALAANSLWQFRKQYGLGASLNKAQSYLLAQRDGGSQWGELHVSAQALIALNALMLDRSALADSYAALANQQLSDGSYQGDAYTTALVSRALVLGGQANPDEVLVSGRLLDADTRLPLANVQISLNGLQARSSLTPSDGRFNFSQLSAGSYSLMAALESYSNVSTSFTATSGGHLNLGDIVLLKKTVGTSGNPQEAPATGTVRGVVTNGDNQPIADAVVMANSSLTASTAADGSYQLANVPAGPVTLSAQSAGYYRAGASGNLAVGGFVVFSPKLAQVQSPPDGGNPGGSSDPVPGVLEGTVTDAATGAPLEGVGIAVTGSTVTSAVTDAAGAYRISNLQPGDIAVTASKSGYRNVSVGARADNNTVVEFSPGLYLDSQGAPPPSANSSTLRGTVVDSVSGEALAGANVLFFDDGNSHAPHLYWRLHFTSGQSGLYVTLSDVEFKDLTGGTDLATGGMPIADSVYATTYVAAHAFDNDDNTSWANAGGYPNWIGYRFATPVKVAEYSIRSWGNAAREYPIAWTLQHSDDGTNWTVADARSGQSFGQGQRQTYQTGASVKTDSQGRYVITGIRSARADVTISMAGYRQSELSLPIQPLEDMDIGQVRLRPRNLDAVTPDLRISRVDAASVVTDSDTLQINGPITVSLVNSGTDILDRPVMLVAFLDHNFNSSFDSGIDLEVGRLLFSESLPPDQSAVLTMQVSGMALFRNPPISVMVNPDGVVLETNLINNTASSGSECLRQPGVGSFQPKTKWHWKGSPQRPSFNAVYGPTIVVQLNDDTQDGVVDARDIPDVVFPALTHLTAVSGLDGSTLWQTAALVAEWGSAAAGDIDGDGFAEIVISNNHRSQLLAFENDGTPKWSVPTGPSFTNPRDAIAIADIDQDGSPEIIHGARVYRSNGALMWASAGGIGGYSSYGVIPIVADLDQDGRNEVIAGRTVYTSSGQVLWNANTSFDGFTGIGNFDDDDFPEIVLVASGRVYLLEHNGTTKWGPVSLPGGGDGGAPTIADVDGDGKPEIGVAGASRYTVFETDGSVKWNAVTIDSSSHKTGSSVFDLDGDGRVEILYSDETNFFIYNGINGAVLAKIANQSGTVLEYPVVADIDNDGHAEILVGSSAGSTAGLRAFEGVNDDWMPTRSIWNQHSYHITNINDDGTIPRVEQPSWLTHNSYRLNTFVGRSPLAAPDLSASLLRLTDNGPGQPYTISVRIANGGALESPEGLALAFYDGNPASGGSLAGSLSLPKLAPGRYADLQINGISNLSSARDIYAWADAAGKLPECNETNNLIAAPFAAHQPLGSLSLGTDRSVYAQNALVTLSGVVGNTGRIAGRYISEIWIADSQAVVLERFQAVDHGVLSSGQTVSRTYTWNTANYRAGLYVVHGILRGPGNEIAAQASAPFEIVSGDGVSARSDLRVNTDRPAYHVSDRVSIGSLARNLAANSPVENASVRLTVLSASGQAVFNQEIPLGELAPKSLAERSSFFAYQNLAEGSYAINGQLTGNAGELLATAQAQFVVKEDSARVLSGSVTAQFASVLNGETQTCLDTAINSGNRDWDALELRRSVFRLDQESAGVQEPLTMSLAAGASQTLPRSFGTESLVPGNYACALEAFADGDWKPLGHANFTVIQEPPNLSLSAAVDKPAYDSTDTASIAASLRNNARYRIEKAVILQLQVRSPAGVAVYARDLALGNLEPGSTAPSSAAYSFAEAAEGLYAVQAYALNAAGDLLASAETQYEVRASAARAISGALTVKYASIQQTEPQTCTDTLRNSSHYAIPNLKLRQRLIRADSGVVVSASAPITLSVPGLGQQILTRVFATDPLTADTEYVCALDAFINENWKELASVSFTVLPPPIRLSAELTMGSKGRLLVLMDAAATGQTSNEPAPSAQRAALEALLKFEGWSYAITTDAAGFAHELRSGQYGVYALFSEIIKLDGTVQKELREAVYRGEGLLEAGSHDQRNSGFDEALGVKYKGKANGVTGAEYGASAVFSSGYADLVLRDKAIRSDIAGAEKHARYLGGNNTGGNDAAVTTHDYGRGRSVYIGYDLLAEFAQAGSASLHADVIKKALLHLQPVISGSLAGQTVPLVLKVSNLGVATPGRAQLSLPTGAVVKDGGSASLENGQAVWTFHLSSGEDKTITVWAQTPVNPGEAVFHANIQSGTAPGFTNRASASLTLNLQVSPSLDAARTLVASGTAYKKVQNWLDKAQSSITAQRYPQAQTELVNAADEAAKLSGAQAQNLRLMIDQALLENGRRL